MSWGILRFRYRAAEMAFSIVFTGPEIGCLLLVHYNLCVKKLLSLKNRYAGSITVKMWLNHVFLAMKTLQIIFLAIFLRYLNPDNDF